MIIKGYIEEDFSQYKFPTMTIATARCSFKCNELNGKCICQNWELVKKADIEISNQELINIYLKNPITKAICLGGLDPLDTFAEVLSFIKDFRMVSNDTIIIYTGYSEGEVRLMGCWNMLAQYPNIILKVGRYIMDCEPHYDELLGVQLASPNQYAVRVN